MVRLADYLFAIAATLWVGVLWAIGYVVAPTLFHTLSDRSLAGSLAGQFFRIVAWIGMGCAAYLLIYLLVREGARALKAAVFWLVVAMLLLVLAGHFGITPIIAKLRAEAFPREVMESVVRDRFVAWHGISSVLYLVQSALGIALVTQLFKRQA